MLEIDSEVLPVLNRVTPLGGLELPTAWPLNVSPELLKVTDGAVPVPESATVCGLPGALSLTEMLA